MPSPFFGIRRRRFGAGITPATTDMRILPLDETNEFVSQWAVGRRALVDGRLCDYQLWRTRTVEVERLKECSSRKANHNIGMASIVV